MSSIQPVLLLLAAVLCFNGWHVAQAQRIRGRAIEAYGSYPGKRAWTGSSSPQASTALASVTFEDPSALASQASTSSSALPAQSSSNMSDDSLGSLSRVSASSDYGDPEPLTTASSLTTAALFPSLVLPPDSHAVALPPLGYESGIVHSADSGTRPSFKLGSLTTAGSSPLVLLSSSHPALDRIQFESDAVAATNPSSAFSGFDPAHPPASIPFHPGASESFRTQANSTASRFVPAFPTGMAPPHPGISGAPALLGLLRKPQTVNATRIINGTTFIQSTINVIPIPGLPYISGFKAPPVVKRPAIALVPSTSTPQIPQQTALTDTQSSQSAVAPAPVQPPVPVQSQTDVEFSAAAMSISPIIQPAPVAPQSAQPLVGNVATQSQVTQTGAPFISSVPSSLVVVVGGQTLANSGPPAVISGQTARVSGGSIDVGTSSEPVPQAQVPRTTSNPDLVADRLTFSALFGGPTAKQTPTPVVVGGPTFSTALINTPGESNAVPAEQNGALATTIAAVDQPTAPTVQPIVAPVQSNAAPAQPNAPPIQPIAVAIESMAAPAPSKVQPVVVGGITYAPARPVTQVGAVPGSETPSGGMSPGPGSVNPVAGQPGQEGSVPAQPKPILASGNTIPGQSSQLAGSEAPAREGNSAMAQANTAASQGNNAPVVLGGIIYTPVAAQPSIQAVKPTPLNLVDSAGVTAQPIAGPLIVNGVPTVPVQTGARTPTPVGIVGGQTIYRQGSNAVVGSQTVAQGSTPILVDNTPVALGPSAIVVGTNTIALPPANPQVAVTPTPVGVVGGQTIVRQGSTVIVGSQTITQGSATISVDNTPVALGPSAILIGTNTISLAPINSQIDIAPTSVGIVAGQTIYRQGSSAVVGSQTIFQGSAPITIDNTPVALGSSALVIGTIPLLPVNAAVTTPAVYSFGGVAVTQGGEPVTIAGTEYSLGPSFVVEGTKTIPLSPAAPSNPVLTIAGQTITANPTGFSIDGTSVSPNGPAITISGTAVSLNPSGVVVGSSTKPFPSPLATSSVLTIGSQTFTALPASGGGGFQIDHSTLLPGSSAVVISGTTYSLNSASSLVIGTSTIPLATAGPSQKAANGALTAGGEAFTPLDSTAVLINGTTLSLSGPAVTDYGTVLSLASGGIVVGSSTYAFATPASNAAATTTDNATIPSVFTIDGDTFTASGKGLAIGGTEVFQGSSAVIISGTPISLGSTNLVIGTSTVPLASVTGLGPALSSGLGSPTAATFAGSGTKGTSEAASVWRESEMWRAMIWWAVVMGLVTIWV